jgi:hypothetical protein
MQFYIYVVSVSGRLNCASGRILECNVGAITWPLNMKHLGAENDGLL